MPHRGIDRLVHNPNYVELNENTTVLLSGTVAFDAATFEIYGPLLNGGRLVITSKDTLLNPQLLNQAITENKVNTMWLTSSLFNQIKRTYRSTRIFNLFAYWWGSVKC